MGGLDNHCHGYACLHVQQLRFYNQMKNAALSAVLDLCNPNNHTDPGDRSDSVKIASPPETLPPLVSSSPVSQIERQQPSTHY